MSRVSIRARATRSMLAAMTLALLAYAAAIHWVVVRHVGEELDAILRRDAAALALAVERTSGGVVRLRQARNFYLTDDDHVTPFVELAASSGELLLAAGPRPAGKWPPFAADAPVGYATLTPGTRSLVSTLDTEGSRLVARLTRPIAHLESERNQLLLELLLPLPVLLLAAIAVSSFLAGRLAAPIRDLARRVAALPAAARGALIETSPEDTEVADLADSFNQLLTRLDRHVADLDAFAEQSAHELATPLTALRARAEVALADRNADASHLRDVMGDMLDEAARLSRVVDRLLLLARGEQGLLTGRLQAADLRGLIDEVALLLAPVAEDAGRHLLTAGEAGIVAAVDADLFKQTLVDLLDNALRHGRGAVRVSLTAQGGEACVRISDEGTGTDPSLIAQLQRGEAPHLGGAGRMGIGIPLARALTEAQGGRFAIGLGEAGGVEVTLHVPLRSP